jgi:DNA-binding CsgD family transcriptional regulator
MIASQNTGLALMHYLAHQPTMDKIAQFLVLNTFAQHQARAALINGVSPNGDILTLGSFGVESEQLDEPNNVKVWHQTPAVEVIRTGEPIHLTEPQIENNGYTLLTLDEALEQPIAVWPLVLAAEKLGSIEVHFSMTYDERAISGKLATISPVLALYLNLISANHEHESDNSLDLQPSVNGSNGHKARSLTDRQMTILRMITAGMTNPQIAARIGFSDSTVRQETMAIYRFLGVNGRREAARVATVKGLADDAHT